MIGLFIKQLYTALFTNTCALTRQEKVHTLGYDPQRLCIDPQNYISSIGYIFVKSSVPPQMLLESIVSFKFSISYLGWHIQDVFVIYSLKRNCGKLDYI